MKKSRALMGLLCLAGCAVSQANAWWGRDDAYVNKSYTTTTIIVRPYNAFSDMSCNMCANGMIPLSLLSGCMNGGCNNNCCRPACPPPAPACGCGWPPHYAPYGEPAYYPAMYYPPSAYYPPPPPPPQHGHHGAPQGYPPPPGYGPGPPCPPGYRPY